MYTYIYYYQEQEVYTFPFKFNSLRHKLIQIQLIHINMYLYTLDYLIM